MSLRNAASVVTHHTHVRHAHTQKNHRERLLQNNKQVVYPDDGEHRDHAERHRHVGGLSEVQCHSLRPRLNSTTGTPAVCGCPQRDTLRVLGGHTDVLATRIRHQTRSPWRGSVAARVAGGKRSRDSSRCIVEGTVDVVHDKERGSAIDGVCVGWTTWLSSNMKL